MRVVVPLLNIMYGCAVAYPPVDAVVIVGKYFSQRRSPASAANNSKLHTAFN